MIELDDSFKPEITRFDVYETVEQISNSNVGVFLQEISRVGFSTIANGKNGATIVDKKVNGKNTPIQFLEHGNKQLILRVVDSRGMENTQIKTIKIHQWKAPQILEFDVERSNQGSGTRAIAKVRYDYSNVNNRTRTQYRIEARELPHGAFNTIYTSSYSTGNVNVENLLLQGEFREIKSYEFKLVALDNYSTRTTIDTISVAVSTGEFGISGASFGMDLTDPNLVGIQTPNIVDENGKNYLLKAFPVGSVIINMTNTNPETYLGGRWRRFAQGRTIIGVDENQSEFNTPWKTGGTKTETLTINQIPSHSGHLNMGYNKGNLRGKYLSNESLFNSYGNNSYGWSKISNEIKPHSENLGGGQAHNNLPPYITVYMWQRYE